MGFHLALAILTGKIISVLTRLKGGGATAAPGLYALKIDPNLVKKLTKNLEYGSIIVSGTNGKTTTSRLIAEVLAKKFNLVHNRAGSNLLRGIASSLILNSQLTGKINKNLAIWEVDEATLPEAIESTKPKIILLLNLFRDQLDRYGEVDSVREKWQKVIEQLPKETTLVVNADDPGLVFIAKKHKGKVVYFGVEDEKLDLPKVENVADIRHCLNCGNLLDYSTLYTAHMGIYSCPKCNFKRPKLNISASKIELKGDFSAKASLNLNSYISTLNYQLPGLYNVYNIAAAASILIELKIDHTQIKSTFEGFSAAFGRFQKAIVDTKEVVTFLIKNPAGANEVLRSLKAKSNLNLLTILNDNIADGRDVSWIWDTNWEAIANNIKTVSFCGARAWDLANRLKYAGVKVYTERVHEDITYSIDQSIGLLKPKSTLIILTTYTALLKVQEVLSKKGALDKWHNQ